MITLAQIKAIYAKYDVEMNEKDFQIMLNQCNEQAGMNGRTPEDWAHFFACQEAHEQQANDAEMRQFHYDAYGE